MKKFWEMVVSADGLAHATIHFNKLLPRTNTALPVLFQIRKKMFNV